MISIIRRCAVMIIISALMIFGLNTVNRPDLRDFPYPYSAMLSIQSHIDGCTEDEFRIIHDFLNTENLSAAYGRGVGLDIGDSMWMYNFNDGTSYMENDGLSAPDYMTWFVGDTQELNSAELIKDYWDMNYIDSIHTVGDFSRAGGDVVFSRELAETAYKTMNDKGIYPSVWINHGTETNVQNLGAYTPITFTKYQRGDDPNSEYYHADLMRSAGVKFIWNSINDVRFGTKNPLFPIFLRDGQKFWGFTAYTGYEGEEEYIYTWSPYDIAAVLSKDNLNKLVENREYSIIATHLGSGTLEEMMNEMNISALRVLRRYQDEGKILVARSSKLLRYAEVRSFIKYEKNDDVINVLSIDDPVLGEYEATYNFLRGITFYVDDSDSAVLKLRSEIVPEEHIVRNPADETGKESIGFVW